MKRLIALLAAACLSVAVCALAEEADSHFVRIYRLIQEADTMAGNGQTRPAAQSYRDALAELKKLQKANPTWNEKVVKFRLNYLSEKLSQFGADAAPEPTPAVVPSIPAASAPKQSEDLKSQRELNELNQQVRALDAERRLLEAKLREALSAQPAAVDPRELRKAEDKIIRLEKENELLKVGLAKQKSKPTPVENPGALDQVKQALAEANLKLQAQAAANATLEAEKHRLGERLQAQASEPRVPSSKRLEPPAKTERPAAALTKPQAEAVAANQKSQEQTERARALIRENAALQERLAITAPAGQLTALQTETENLKKHITSMRALAKPDTRDQNLRRELAAARSELASEKSANEALRLEKAVLERQFKDSAGKNQITSNSKTESRPSRITADERKVERQENERLKKLESERQDLQKKLAAANAELAKKSARPTATPPKSNREIESLKSRLAALESKRIPYTAEELALFKAPAAAPPRSIQVASAARSPATFQLAAENSSPKPAAEPIREAKPVRKSINELPPGAGPLVSEAQRAFAARRLDEAEAKYKQALKLDDKSVFLLANLATIQLEENRFEEAEKNLNLAIANAPEDAFSLLQFGILKFRQEKYDDALNALSQAAKFDPQNAEAQNYLGITLSQQGQRAAAETALRKAIQLSPGYPIAHYNLAVVYATQQPPFRELARLHYQKATSAGHPKNAELEKLLAESNSAETK